MNEQCNFEAVAIEKYRECVKTNEDLALVYLMNAITHDPKIAYLEEYVKLLSGMKGDVLDSALPQAYNILSMVALNGPADQVPDVQRLIARVQELEFSSGTEGGQLDRQEGMIEEVWQEAKEFEWGSLVENGMMFDAKRMQAKSEALKQLLATGVLSDEDTERYVDELDQTQWQLNLIAILNEISDGVAQVREELSLATANPHRVSALMAQVANALSQLWCLRPEGPIPREELDEICDAKQELLRACEEPAQRLLSQKAYTQAYEYYNKLLKSVDEDCNNSETWKIERCQETIPLLQDLVAQITYKEYRSRVLGLIKCIGDRITSFSRQRYAKYQKDMASYALDAIKKFDDTTVVLEKDVDEILKTCHIAEIDESILSPEAAGLFQFAKSMLVDKLGRVKRAEFDMTCVTSTKIRLEQY